MNIPPWTILAGLGGMSRRETCEFLAVFEEVTLSKLASCKVEDLVTHISGGVRGTATGGAFERQIRSDAERLSLSDATEAELKLRLWSEIRNGMGLEPCLPLSERHATIRTAEVAHSAAKALAASVRATKSDAPPDARALARFTRFFPFGKNRIASFDDVVGAHASRLIAEADRLGVLGEDARRRMAADVRARLAKLPPDLRDQSVKSAEAAGDRAIVALLASGGPLVGIGIAVELAGFSAYILAAQAAAVMPFLGANTAVVWLAVLANPLFILPVLGGGWWAASNRVKTSARRQIAANLTTTAALRGLAEGRDGLKRCLDLFKTIQMATPVQHGRHAADTLHPLARIPELSGEALAETPGNAPGRLSGAPGGKAADLLRSALFPDDAGSVREALAVGALTIGDVAYDLAAIDPWVIAAADFSRAEDLASVSRFGEFAETVQGLSGAALEGSAYNLRGYVAEQLVAARLIERGHQVQFPDAPNAPGYDLLVDGETFQVKCLSDIDGLRKHFATYPDIPVYAPAELAGVLTGADLPWGDKVFFIDGYTLEVTDHVMTKSLATAAALDDLDVPIFAVAVSAARNVHGWWAGKQCLSELPFEIALDGTLKGTLAVAGGFAGKGIGFLLFGPAGAIVFSGVGGAGALLGSGWARNAIETRLSPEWRAGLGKDADELQRGIEAALYRKRSILRSKIQCLAGDDRPEVVWLKRRLQDDELALLEALTRMENLARERDAVARTRGLLKLMHEAAVHPWAVRRELSAVMQTLAAKESLGEVTARWFGVGLKQTGRVLGEVARPSRNR